MSPFIAWPVAIGGVLIMTAIFAHFLDKFYTRRD